MRALQIMACGLGLLVWGLGHWLGVLSWPLEIAVRTGSRQAPHTVGTTAAPIVRTVQARDRAPTLVLPDVVTPGGLIAGVQVRVLEPFGRTHGLEGFAVGTRTQYARFGVWEGRQWHPGVPGLVVNEDDTAVILTALGGRFDAQGRVELTVLPFVSVPQP